jgi:Spy/CpxP family protein refolding chaperone
MRTSQFGVAALLAAAASVAVINAQHTPPVHHATHQVCAPHAPASGETAASDHASLLAAKLELTSEQRATVERVSSEACAAMAKYHQQILDVLTPEQQAKLRELHEDGQSDLHAWFKKLHGGR